MNRRFRAAVALLALAPLLLGAGLPGPVVPGGSENKASEVSVRAARPSPTAPARRSVRLDPTAGEPTTVVEQSGGGAHGDWVLELSDPRGRPVASVRSAFAPFELADVDGDGWLEILTRDSTFAYWRGAFATSPAPRIILRLRGGRVVPALDLMRGPAMSPSELEDLAAHLRGASDQEVAGALLQRVLAGHPVEAIDLADLLRLSREFRWDFWSTLATSPYWGDLAPLR